MYDESLKSTDSSWPERYFDPFKGANKLSKDWRQLLTSLVIGRVKNPTEFHNSKREESNQGNRNGKKTWHFSTISNMKIASPKFPLLKKCRDEGQETTRPLWEVNSGLPLKPCKTNWTRNSLPSRVTRLGPLQMHLNRYNCCDRKGLVYQWSIHIYS